MSRLYGQPTCEIVICREFAKVFTILSDSLGVSISLRVLLENFSFVPLPQGKRLGGHRPILTMLCALGLGLGLGTTVALAKPKTAPPITITQKVFKAEKSGARGAQLHSNERGKPGDILIYRTSYRNETKRALPNVVVTVPVPPGVAYVPDSALPAVASASRDNLNYFPITEIPSTAPVATWRSLRWAPRELAPLSEFIVEHRVRVVDPSGE